MKDWGANAIVTLIEDHEFEDILSKGGAFVVHGRGGIGRACMIAARVMVELGEKPDDAIALLRRVRHPNAVETSLQEGWVANGACERNPTS